MDRATPQRDLPDDMKPPSETPVDPRGSLRAVLYQLELAIAAIRRLLVAMGDGDGC